MLRNFISFSFAVLFLAVSAEAKPARYDLDKAHTGIFFFVNHLGFSDKIGQFRDYDGYFLFDKDNPKEGVVEVVIRPKGIDTGSKELDEELQKDKWFNTAKYPEIKFKSTRVEVTGENKADVTGWLTMLGVEKPMTLKVSFNREGKHPVNEKHVAGFSAKAVIYRSAFGMDNFVPMVGDEVRVLIEAEGFKQE